MNSNLVISDGPFPQPIGESGEMRQYFVRLGCIDCGKRYTATYSRYRWSLMIDACRGIAKAVSMTKHTCHPTD